MKRLLRSLVVPEISNGYKSHIISNRGLASIIIVLLTAQIWVHTPFVSSQVLGTQAEFTSDQIVKLTNQARKQHNIPPLASHPLLEKAAYAKIHDMFSNNYWDHISPTNQPPWNFILDAGYSYQYAGENLGKDFHDSTALVEAWLNSPDHRENLLKADYEDIGVAIGTGTLNGEKTTLIVQFFGKRFPTSAPITTQTSPQEVYKVTATIVNRQQNAAAPSGIGSTKMIALISVTTLALVIGLDAFLLHRVKKLPRISGKYWSHLLLLYTVGVVTLFL